MSKMTGKRLLAPPAAGKRVAPPPRRPFGVADGILIFLCGALLLLILAAAVVPRIIGCTSYAIASDSMSPTLRRGDLVFALPVTLDQLAENEIIVFETDTGLITHRVYSIDETQRTLRTKADASVYLDARPVGEEALLGRVLYKLPLLGYVSLFLGGREVSP